MPMITGRNMTALEPTSALQVQIGRGVATRSISMPAPDDLEMSWAVPGGDDTCSFTLTATGGGQAMARPDALTQGMPVRVVDRRTGEILWAGRVVDPGMRQDGAQRGFRVNAVGSRQDLERIVTLKSYIDRDVGEGFKEQGFYRQGSVNVGDGSGFTANVVDALNIAPTGNLEFSLPQGSTVASGSLEAASYLKGLGAVLGLPNEAPDLYYIAWSEKASVASFINFEVLLGTRTHGNLLLYSLQWNTPQVDNAAKEGVGGWTADDGYYYTLRWNRGANGAGTQVADQWMKVANVITVNKRYDRYGVQWTATSTVDLTSLYPYQVVEDMLGTMLPPRFAAGDITRSSTGNIDQASWYKGISARDLLDYVNGYDSDSYWAVWAPATPDGLPRLDWKKWGTTSRYVLDQSVDYELAGGADQWANSALVVWQRGGTGIPQSTRAYVDVAAINRFYGPGYRSIAVDLTDRGVMDGPAARTIGEQELAALTVDRNSGQVTIRGPIMDDWRGRLVQPWEIRPGSPLQLTAAPQQHTAGLPLAYDGETVFRLSGVKYSASSNTATLDLDGGHRALFKAPRRAKPRIIPFKK